MTYTMHNLWNTISYLPLKSELNHCLISLARWPDFGAVEHREEFIRLAAILSPRAMTAEQLQASSGYNEHVVNSFLNAACLDGLLKTSEVGSHHKHNHVRLHVVADKLKRAFHSLSRSH
jgi:hypothetical protein